MAPRPQEIWHTTTHSRVGVWVTDSKGAESRRRVGGKPGSVLRITKEDREMNQERVVDARYDPFTNGMLVPVKSSSTPSEHAIPNEELVGLFALEIADFADRIGALNEVNSYRLLRLQEEGKATVAQVTALKDMIEKRWPISSGPTPTYKELKAIGAQDGVTSGVMVR